MEDRLKIKLDTLLNEKKTYESEQLAITLFTRLERMKRHNEARQILLVTAKRLVDMNDVDSARALMTFYVDHLKKQKVAPDESVVKEIEEFTSHLEDELLDEFTDGIVKYAQVVESSVVRKIVVARYATLKRWGKAYLHVVKLDSAKELEDVLMDWAFDEDTLKEERDLIICRGILECLALGQWNTCNECFIACAKRWRAVPYEPTPLLNCVAFVLKVLKMENGSNMLLELRTRYADSLDRDPLFDTFLEHCQKRYFHQTPSANPLMSMISGLFGNSNN